MWLKPDRKHAWQFSALLVLIACSSSTLACAKPISVCPKHGQTSVRQIDIFDGKPEDQAYLAPDDSETAPNTYTVGGIYDQGRTVTVRCRYSDGQMQEVELKQRIQTCRYTELGKKSSAALLCQ